LTLTLIAGNALAETAAVMPLQTDNLSKNHAMVLDRLLAVVVAENSNWEVISARDIDAMLGFENLKDLAQCTDVSCAAEIGGALGTRYLVVTTANRLGDSLVMTMTVLDMKDQRAIARRSLTGPNDENAHYHSLANLVQLAFGKVGVPGDNPANQPKNTNTNRHRIRITSDRPGVIYIDGQKVDQETPALISGAELGVHSVVVRGKNKMGTARVTVPGDPTRVTSVHIELNEPLVGHIRVRSEVPETTVFVDGQRVGVTPLDIRDQPPGVHEIEFRASGYVPSTRKVTVEGAGTVVVTAYLKKVQRHRIVATTDLGYMLTEIPADDVAVTFIANLSYMYCFSHQTAIQLGIGYTLDTGVDGDIFSEAGVRQGLGLAWGGNGVNAYAYAFGRMRLPASDPGHPRFGAGLGLEVQVYGLDVLLEWYVGYSPFVEVTTNDITGASRKLQPLQTGVGVGYVF
jgi:hypothetical protein